MNKQCSKCRKIKDISNFYKDKNRKNGIYPQCKQCKSEYDEEYQFKWYKKNKNIKVKYQIKHIKEKRKIDPIFKLIDNIRKRINNAIKTNSKSENTIRLLGCTIEDLKIHLESMFKNGINWNNYGDWHIDHIRPCNSFDLSKPKEQRKCFHYSNLQPLWAVDNLKKSGKW